MVLIRRKWWAIGNKRSLNDALQSDQTKPEWFMLGASLRKWLDWNWTENLECFMFKARSRAHASLNRKECELQKSEEKAHQDHTTSQFSYWNQWNSQRQKLQWTKMGTSGRRNKCLYVVRWINTKILLVDRTLTQLKKPQVIHEIIYFVQSWFEDKDFAIVMVSSRRSTRFGEGEMAQTYTGTSSVRKPNLTYMRKAHRR